MAAEGKAIIFKFIYNLKFIYLFFISLVLMKDHPWDLNQTWPVGRKWCRFTNAPKIPTALPQIWGAKNIKFWTTFCDLRTRHHISPERNVALRKKSTSVNLKGVPYKITYFP